MLKIRKKQIEAQSHAVRVNFEDRLIDFLLGEFPEAKRETENEIRNAVHEQVERALKYGLTEEQHVAIYLTTAWLLGRSFDVEFPVARDILTAERKPPEVKVDELARFTELLFVALEEEG